MSSVTFSLHIMESDVEIGKRVNRALSLDLIPRLQSVSKRLSTRVRELVRSAVKSTPEFQSLVSNDPEGLGSQLGIANAQIIVERIIDSWVNTIRANVIDLPRGIASINIEGLQADFADLLSDPEAEYVSENGHQIPWLRWLLLEGDITILGYEVRTIRSRIPKRVIAEYSRTGLSIMWKKKGSMWRIPAEFAGSESDNFITRALNTIEPQLDVIFRQEMKKVFK